MTRCRIFFAIAVWCGYGLVCPLNSRAAHADLSIKTFKEWVRVATCADVRTVVAAVGVTKAEAVAKAAGASEAQIAKAKRCLR